MERIPIPKYKTGDFITGRVFFEDFYHSQCGNIKRETIVAGIIAEIQYKKEWGSSGKKWHYYLLNMQGGDNCYSILEDNVISVIKYK